jgi:hypothetical protein
LNADPTEPKEPSEHALIQIGLLNRPELYLKFARSALSYRSRKAEEDAAVLARMGELALAYLCTALNGRSVADTVAKHFGAGCVRFVPQTNMTSPRNRGEVKTAMRQGEGPSVEDQPAPGGWRLSSRKPSSLRVCMAAARI